MTPNKIFLNQPKAFWANVRSISQQGGYTDRATKKIKTFTVADMVKIMTRLDLGSHHLFADGSPTKLGADLEAFFAFRAEILNTYVEPRLMDVDDARRLLEKLKGQFSPKCPIPDNKQKGEKKQPAYLTGMVNILVEAHSDGYDVDYAPGQLTTVVYDDAPLRTLSRRVDGCFPSHINPIGLWEIKEYYYTTTFGSRVADGVYESLLDGMEIEELRIATKVDIKHLLIIDSHFTWWQCGRSYLCRMIDMLHMGYVDEIIFGMEVEERIPVIMREWVKLLQERERPALTQYARVAEPTRLFDGHK